SLGLDQPGASLVQAPSLGTRDRGRYRDHDLTEDAGERLVPPLPWFIDDPPPGIRVPGKGGERPVQAVAGMGGPRRPTGVARAAAAARPARGRRRPARPRPAAAAHAPRRYRLPSPRAGRAPRPDRRGPCRGRRRAGPPRRPPSPRTPPRAGRPSARPAHGA